jgi:hypothetical protein
VGLSDIGDKACLERHSPLGASADHFESILSSNIIPAEVTNAAAERRSSPCA